MRPRIWSIYVVALTLPVLGSAGTAEAAVACVAIDSQCSFTASRDTTVYYAGTGPWKISVVLPTLTPLHRLDGTETGGGLGTALVVADLDRDGRPDLIAGEPGAPGGSDDGSGRVYVFEGQDPVPQMTISAPPGITGFGTSLATGDVDGDGFPDLVVGGHGAVSAFEGQSGRLLTTFFGVEPGDDLGAHVAIGDMDGDGLAEIVASSPGAHSGAGQLRFHSVSLNQDVFIDGEPGEALGSSLAVAEFELRDGELDIVAGARDPLGAAGVVIVSDGARSGFIRVRDTDPQAEDGLVVADLNRDGLSDIVVGSPGAAGGDGHVTAIDGKTHAFLWNTAADLGSAGRLGRSLAVGDLNGDGFAEVIAGAPGTGQVFVLTNNGRLLSKTSPVERPGGLGLALAVADFDRDGTADLAIGAPLTDVEGSGATPPLVNSGVIETRTSLKTSFQNGDTPTAGQFQALIDSFITLDPGSTSDATMLPPPPSVVWASTSNVDVG